MLQGAMSLQPSRQCDSSLHEQSDGKSDFTTSTLEHCVQRFSEKEIHRLGRKLIVATRNGNTAKVKRLIRGSAPINWQDDTGNTSLHMASAFGKTDIVELFIRSKADVNIANKSKNTPLMFAAFNNKMFIVRVLVEAGADAITLGDESKDAARWANYGDGTGTISEYLTNEAVHIRFHRSARDETNQLHLAKGRSLRAFERDLKEIVNFDDHMVHRLKHFCVGKRP